MAYSVPTGRRPARVELARRESGSLRVALVWWRETDVVAVRVRDGGAGDHFELVVAAADALAVYYHPYAYAAFCGVDYGLCRSTSGSTGATSSGGR